MERTEKVGLAGALASTAVAAAGIAASAMLLVDYVRPAPVFCSEGGGCDALKHTIFATPYGVPLPLIGLVGFLALGVVGLLPGRLARRAQLGLAIGGGLAGVMLLALQALIGQFCPYCFVADTSAILALGLATWRVLRDVEAPHGPVWRLGAASAFTVAAGVPLVAGFHVDVTPQAIHDEIARTPPGKITVVDFVDYECPFCRMTHAELEPVLEAHRDKIRLVRRQVPLIMHPHARDAARAACCGERLGHGEAMANALFTADVDDLTPGGCERIAQSLGLPLDAYRDCVSSPATDASIEADKTEFKAAHGYALPTVWVDETPMIGAQPQEAIVGVVQAALAHVGG